MIGTRAKDCLFDRRFLHGLARTHRQTLDRGPEAPSETQTQPPRRPAPRRRPPVFRGHPLDPLDRGPMERVASTIWEEEHGQRPAQDLDRGWHAREVVESFPGPVERPGPHTLERVLHGRNLFQREKRGAKVGKTKRGKGSKLMVLVDGQGTPLGVHLDSASPAEVKLAEVTLQAVKVGRLGAGRPRTRPERIIADKAYDSDPLRERLGARGIELIVPHRGNRKKPPTQDGRPLRRYKRRWIVERTNAWLQNFRRLLVRHERSATIFLGLVHMACAMIVLKRVFERVFG